MSLSARYNSLKVRLELLESHYVRDLYAKSQLGELEDKDYDLCRGYRVLCHAEIESYLEDRADEILNFSYNQWRNEKKITRSLLSLFSYFKFLDDHKTSLETKVGKMCNDFRTEVIRNNHGLKEANLKNLFKPLGIDFSSGELDQTWINTMNSYGESRGIIAHTSYQTQTPIDLTTEKDILDQIREGLEHLDELVNNLLTPP